MNYTVILESLGRDFPAKVSVTLTLKSHHINLLRRYKCFLEMRVCSFVEAKKLVKVKLKQLIVDHPYEISIPAGVCVHQIESMIQENLDVLQVFFNLSQLSGGAAICK